MFLSCLDPNWLLAGLAGSPWGCSQGVGLGLPLPALQPILQHGPGGKYIDFCLKVQVQWLGDSLLNTAKASVKIHEVPNVSSSSVLQADCWSKTLFT